MPKQGEQELITGEWVDDLTAVSIAISKTGESLTHDEQEALQLALQNVAYVFIHILAERDLLAAQGTTLEKSFRFVAAQMGSMRSFYEQLARPPGRYLIDPELPF